MHPHLQIPRNKEKCGEVIALLDECHARGFLWKALGACNAADRRVRECLRAERIERTKKNREAARGRRKDIQEKWAEIDKNS